MNCLSPRRNPSQNYFLLLFSVSRSYIFMASASNNPQIFETNSSFHVKWRIQFPIFQEFFASIENDFFWTKARH